MAGRVAWIDSPRELVGAAVKTLGGRFNSTPAELAAAGITAQDVINRVDMLRRQVCHDLLPCIHQWRLLSPAVSIHIWKVQQLWGHYQT